MICNATSHYRNAFNGATETHPTLAKHLAAINAGQVERTNIIGLRKAINAMERSRDGYSVGATAPRVDPDEMWQVEETISKVEPRAGTELAISGLAQLNNRRFAKRFGEFERSVIDNLDVFRLVGFQRIGRHGWHSTPIYRAVAQNGDSFLFRNIPWQSGGNGPEIVQEGEF